MLFVATKILLPEGTGVFACRFVKALYVLSLDVVQKF